MKPFKWLPAYLLIICAKVWAFDAEHIVWDKTPISLHLTLKEERLVHFPKAIRIIDNEAEHNVSILKVKDTLYLKAKTRFKNKRLFIQLMPQGDVIILNLSTTENKSLLKPIEVVLENEAASNSNLSEEAPNPFEINAITLTRFAIQSLYAPQRLLVIPPGVNRIPMQTRQEIQLIYGASIKARPLISWHGGSLFVTAIELRNLLNKEVVIDPRQMAGNWQTATFYPTNTLKARGKNDTTTVFLISDRPFHESYTATREFVR